MDYENENGARGYEGKSLTHKDDLHVVLVKCTKIRS
jgi:hypothetical protein